MELNDQRKLFRQSVNGVAPHEFGAADTFQVLDNDVRLVAILEHDGIAGGPLAVDRLPQGDVNEYPISAAVACVGDLAAHIAILDTHSLRPYRLPRLRHVAALELSLWRPSAGMVDAALVPGRLTFDEAAFVAHWVRVVEGLGP